MAGSQNKKQVVLLFSELSYYFLAGLDSINDNTEISVSVVHWSVNPEAPFEFRFPKHVQFFSRSDFDDDQLSNLLEELQPDLIFCAGWLDKGYIRVLRSMNSVKRVLTMDNQWRSTPRQQLARLASKFNFLRMFDAVWVPGEKQKTFAQKLGFKEAQIQMGFYSADLNYFNAVYQSSIRAKEKGFPHVFLYLGRYAPEKGVDMLIEAFEELKKEQDNDWKLICAGTGKLRGNYKDTKDIQHLGFVQPYDLDAPMSAAGVFVLPSTFEPWGLVVHEASAAGLPLIVTDVVGAAGQFATEENALLIDAGSKASLKQALANIMGRSDSELLSMAKASHRIAQRITPEMWAEKLFSFLEQ